MTRINTQTDQNFATNLVRNMPIAIKESVREEQPNIVMEFDRRFLESAMSEPANPVILDHLLGMVEKNKGLLTKNPVLARNWINDLFGYAKSVVENLSLFFFDGLSEVREALSGLEAVQHQLDDNDDDRTGMRGLIRELDQNIERVEKRFQDGNFDKLFN